jgi:hypothetical protein
MPWPTQNEISFPRPIIRAVQRYQVSHYKNRTTVQYTVASTEYIIMNTDHQWPIKSAFITTIDLNHSQYRMHYHNHMPIQQPKQNAL